MSNIKFSLVVPFYNEEDHIKNTSRVLILYLNKHCRNQYELIFVNDGSTDNSVEVLKNEIKNHSKIRLISYLQNKGRGYALSQGFRKAKGSVIGYIDSDLEIKEKYILLCLKRIPEYDVAVVSKHHLASKVQTTILRRLASKIYNLWVGLILGSQVSDHQGGLKIFKHEVVNKVLSNVKSNGWLFDTEILYYAQKSGFKVYEVPLTVRYGFDEIRKSMIIDFLKSIILILKLRYQK